VPPCDHSAEAANSWVENRFNEEGAAPFGVCLPVPHPCARVYTHTLSLTPDGCKEYVGMEATFELLKIRIAKLKIDGLMGFSLGAAVVAAFVARCRGGTYTPAMLRRGARDGRASRQVRGRGE
jgi:hypothetical protein